MSFLMSACCCCCIVNNCHIFVIGHHQYTSTQNQNHKRNLCLSIKNRPRTTPILKLVRVICKFCSSHYLTDVSHQLGGCFGGFRTALYLYNVFIVVHENFRCLEYLSALFFTLHVQVTLISLDWIHDNVLSRLDHFCSGPSVHFVLYTLTPVSLTKLGFPVCIHE